MSWSLKEKGFDSERIAVNGNKFMIGNGQIGYRGTLEEFGEEQLTAVIVAGLYDQVGAKWREPVNAPNGLYTRLYVDGEALAVLSENEQSVGEHVQELDFSAGIHGRRTVFKTSDGKKIDFAAERFASADRLDLLAARFRLSVSEDCELVIETGINGDVWDINGPHLEQLETGHGEDDSLLLTAVTQELKRKLAVAERIGCGFGEQAVETAEQGIYRKIKVSCKAGEEYVWTKYVSVQSGLESQGPAAVQSAAFARQAGYEELLRKHRELWAAKWELSDVRIAGDEEAQFALRYSLYQLLIIAPEVSQRVSIPARGLSGQVYKGAVFWDTEMFMLPFFLYTRPEVARNLMMYRVHTLPGAKRKAAEYGYQGAFFAWESQDTGDDACTLFNVNDVFTGRPMRTYFRDKQVHISADVAHGIWQYYSFTGDDSILLDGGAEVVWEVAKFFYSYAYYNAFKQRYEILDVTGPDEYHERVNNNAFTNYLVKRALEITLQTADLLAEKAPGLLGKITDGDPSGIKLSDIRHMLEHLYVPQPDPETGLIEQFDGYYRLEDVALADLKSRILHKNEYWGGGNGLATTTRILKQADVVLMLHLFKEQFGQDVKKANWSFYEPRTEHGSSLSPCVYALVAADIGMADWGYPYFLRTATIDLTGDSKQYVGDLYIGGTHPAANGGAWMAAVLGFAGVHAEDGTLHIHPALPEQWEQIEFITVLRGQKLLVSVSGRDVAVTSRDAHGQDIRVSVNGETAVCPAGGHIRLEYSQAAQV